jgi:HK97 family phage prohead protease
VKSFLVTRSKLAQSVGAGATAGVVCVVRSPAVVVSHEGGKILRWDSAMNLNESPDAKKFTEVKNPDGVIVDYRDVKLKGYLSTFQGTTPADRDGEYVLPGAFTETITTFMKNPVLLVNHQNSVASLAGGFSVVREDRRGLYVEADLSNAPGNIDVRFKVAEGYLRTLSMGGLFHFDETGRGIFRVNLFEGSLTPIPANPDALFSTRSLTDAERKSYLTLSAASGETTAK